MIQKTLHRGKRTIITHNEVERNIIKTLNKDYPTEVDVRRFRNEFDILQDINIEGVRKVLDYKLEGSQPQITLDFIDGEQIKDFLNSKDVKLVERLRLFIRLTHILSRIHRKGIIHKNINPSNILVKSNEEVYLIDFSIASKFTLKQPNLGNPEKLEGSLNYISPEQTGRMNRSVDYRTDLYSLGATFYKLLGGKELFEGAETMSLIHSHLAKVPQSLSQINSDIPEQVSNIVMKLLEKSPEERYQSALGVRSDLEKCIDFLEKKEEIPLFRLGAEDFSGKLQIPEKLYGRSEETVIILDAFERVKAGAVELTLVAGYSGTGKSVLVNETHKPLTSTKGYFIEGKFDQFQRNIPFYAWIEAFKNFVDLLLTENEKTLEYWKSTILEAVGDNGAVLTDVIPNLELVIGKQAEVVKLGGQEAHNRFNYVMQNFLRAITTSEHPLIIFIDDLQWADLASLNLLKTLVTDKSNEFLLCVGAYRDNEVSETHPLIATLNEIKKVSNNLNEISIGNLNEWAVLDMLSESLNNLRDDSLLELNRNILSKTQGNAFFTHQYLKNLYEEVLLKFDFKKKEWAWDNKKIQETNFTDNVVDFMAKKVNNLSKNTQRLLKLASCIGNKYDLATLSIIAQQDEIEHSLDEAILERLIFPTTLHNYKFTHDRIQQAAYSLIPEDEKQLTHLKIGRVLYNSFSPEEREERLFDIVNHFNLAKEIFTGEDAKTALILNKEAAKKARVASSFAGMLNYIEEAKALLPENPWSNSYEITLEVYKILLDAEYLNANYAQTENHVVEIVANAKDAVDKVEASALLSKQSTMQGNFMQSIDRGFDALKLLGIEQPTDDIEAVQQYFFHEVLGKTSKVMDEIGVENLPVNTNREAILMIEILDFVTASAYIISDNLLVQYCCAKGVELSLEYGNAPSSPKHYGNASLFFGPVLGDYKRGYKLAEAGYSLAQESKRGMIAKVSIVFSNWQTHWEKHLKYGKEILLDGMDKGFDMGEVEFATYNIFCYVNILFAEGTPLSQINKELEERFWALSIKYYNSLNIQIVTAFRWVINTLKAEKIESINDTLNDFNEAEFEQYGIDNNTAMMLAIYYTYKAQALLVLDQPEKAYDILQLATPYTLTILSYTTYFDQNFYTSLLSLKKYEQTQDTKLLDAVDAHQENMKLWADNCKENFLHKYKLVEAEKAKVTGKDFLEIIELYEEAIESASQHDFIQDAGLANECCAKYLIALGREKMAKGYLLASYHFYKLWGATEKLLLLSKQYPILFKAEGFSTEIIGSQQKNNIPLTNRGSGLESFDIKTVLKASQSLSQQIRLQDLIDEMLQILLQNSGANRIALLREEDKIWWVEADKKNKQKLITQPTNYNDYQNLPKQLINYVLRSKDYIILDDIAKSEQFAKDSYVQSHRSKSVFVIPVKKQDNILALLYLENDLNAGVFHKKHYELVKALTTQLAISIENTLLYKNLERKVDERTKELQHAYDKTQLINEELIQAQEELETQRDFVEAQNKILAHTNNQMKLSITSAQTIQAAILPAEDIFKQLFQDYFIINRPRDVVSGDFYWLNEIEGKVILVVADCTGHGVPGAFMTLIGYSLLEKIINDEKITKPKEILDYLHKGIFSLLKQDETGNAYGMDAVVLTLQKQDDNKVKICFSGAKNYLYYFDYDTKTLKGIKGSRKSIGGRQMSIEFTEEELLLSSNSIIYMGSDGIADQNNIKRRSFTTARLKENLIKNAQLDLSVQKEQLEKEIDNFMDGAKQRDDMLWMGIKL